MKKWFKRRIALFLILSMILTGLTPIQVFAGTDTLYPAADKGFDVYSSDYNTNKIEIGSAVDSYWIDWMKGALRFDVSSISGTISSAKLRVYVTEVTNGSKLDVYGSENVTFTDSGTEDITSDTSISVGEKNVTPGDLNTWVEIDVLTYLSSKVPGNSYVSFVLEGDSTDGDKFFAIASKEAGSNQPELVIVTADPVPGTLQFDPTTASVGEGTSSTNLTVTRTGGSDGAVTVDYTVTGGTATGSGTDYTLASGTLSFADGETSKNISVSIVDDSTYESSETVEVTLSNATGGASLGSDKVATLTITDNDAVPGTLQFDPTTASVGEGTSSTNLTVTRTGGSDGAVTVDYAVTGGTATGSGTDYTLASGTLSFADGETSKNISLSIVDDSTYESSETVEVTLSNATGGASLGSDKVATLTITDNDAVPGTLQFDPTTASVGEGTSSTNLTVTRTGGSDGAVTVDYAVTDGTATGSGTDYTLASGTLSFADGETSKNISVSIVDDSTYESSETVEVTLSNATGGASLGSDKVATLTITDNDAVPGTLQFDPTTASVGEGTSSTNLTVTRTGGSDGAVSVDYAVTGGTATGSGTDYTLASGTLSFADGETSKNISVSIVDDSTYESSETVEVTLSNATGGASLGSDKVATLTITDNDAVPGTLQFDPTTASVGEGTSSTNLTVTRTGGSDGAVTVDYAVTGGTATGSGTDYTLASGTLSFSDGETSKNISVSIVDDSTYESSETVEVTLSNATGGASLGSDKVVTLTITENDSAPVAGTLQFDPTTASVSEGTSSTNLTVTRTGGSDGAVTVDYAVTGGTATGSGMDYTLASGTLSFADGETSKNISVSIVDDSTYESSETVEVTLSNATGGASLGSDKVATLTITENDSAPVAGTLQFDPTTASVGEGTSSTNLTVTRTGGSDGAVTVDYAVTGGTATGSGTDYTLASGTLSFADSETSKNISVSIVDDSTYESSETVEVTLSNATGGASLGSDKVATLTITENDSAPVAGTLQFDPTTAKVSESTSSTNLTVTRTGGSDGAVTVDYAVTGGTATGSGTDYTLASGTLSFADGETSKNISVSIVDDSTTEQSETIEITLSSPTNGSTLGSNTVATVTIQDNDAEPGTVQFEVASISVVESIGQANINVTLSSVSDGAIKVNYTVAEGTAIGNGSDFTLANGQVEFEPGSTSKTISASITNDTVFESDETFELTLTGVTGGATLGSNQKVLVTILNDDSAPTSGSNSGGSSSDRESSNRTDPEPQTPSNVVVKVNGKSELIGKEKIDVEGGLTTRTVVVDSNLAERKIEEALRNNSGESNVIEVPIQDTTSSQVKVALTGDVVKKLENSSFVVSAGRNQLFYNIPAKELTIDQVAKEMGVEPDRLKDIEIDIRITRSDEKTLEEVEKIVTQNNSTLITAPIDFEIVAHTKDADGKEIETRVNNFDVYVERIVELPRNIDPNRVTTGIVLNPDLTYSHVPTNVFEQDGRYFVSLNSLTNSKYSAIWNPVTVESAKGHWSYSVANDMASRLILVDYLNYDPESLVTRGEFADCIVRALGLYREGVEIKAEFKDVMFDDPFARSIWTACEWNIANGYPDGTFRPSQAITKSEAMAMLINAMQWAKYPAENGVDYMTILNRATANETWDSKLAIISNKTELFGTSNKFDGKSNVTQAQALYAIRKLLIESELINN